MVTTERVLAVDFAAAHAHDPGLSFRPARQSRIGRLLDSSLHVQCAAERFPPRGVEFLNILKGFQKPVQPSSTSVPSRFVVQDPKPHRGSARWHPISPCCLRAPGYAHALPTRHIRYGLARNQLKWESTRLGVALRYLLSRALARPSIYPQNA